MAEPAAARLRPVPGEAGGVPDGDGKDGGGLAGRVLDIAGIAAAALLAVIIADIWSGGKISAWARRLTGCSGCGGQDQAEQAEEGGAGGDG
jgi:hypothetical protein